MTTLARADAVAEMKSFFRYMGGLKDTANLPRADIVKLAALGAVALGHQVSSYQFCEGVWKACYSADDESLVACGETGIVELVLECMVKYPQNDGLNTLALCALHNLLHSDGINVDRFIAHDGLRALYSVSERHADSDGVASRVCSITSFVLGTGEPEVRAAVLSARGLKHVCKAMAAHPGDPKVQQSGCSALAYLAMSDEGRAAILASPRALSLVRAAKATHSDKEEVVGITGALLALLVPHAEAE